MAMQDLHIACDLSAVPDMVKTLTLAVGEGRLAPEDAADFINRFQMYVAADTTCADGALTVTLRPTDAFRERVGA